MQNEEINCGNKKPNEQLDQNYWDEKWKSQETGWDIGYASPPIEEYLKQYINREAKILIPGCGNAYEAEFLVREGFKNVSILDISPKATEILQERFKEIPQVKIICEDFFQHRGNYDLVIEQTFFCAIPTILRNDYAKKMHEILNENGKIMGVLFDYFFEKQGPPFGGSIPEYHFIFKKYFEILKMEPCYNSVAPRLGSEAFIILKKK